MTDEQKQEVFKRLQEFGKRLLETVKTIWEGIKKAVTTIYWTVRRRQAEEGDQGAAYEVYNYEIRYFRERLQQIEATIRVTKHSKSLDKLKKHKKYLEGCLEKYEAKRAEILDEKQ